jgi:hypothetical protein
MAEVNLRPIEPLPESGFRIESLVMDHNGERRISIRFSEKWLMEALDACDAIDSAVVMSPEQSVADQLQTLQILAYRWEQRHQAAEGAACPV